MPKQIRFMDYDDNIIESYINPENNVFISINRHKLNDDQVEYICLSKEDLKDFIDHLNNLHEQL